MSFNNQDMKNYRHLGKIRGLLSDRFGQVGTIVQSYYEIQWQRMDIIKGYDVVVQIFGIPRGNFIVIRPGQTRLKTKEDDETTLTSIGRKFLCFQPSPNRIITEMCRYRGTLECTRVFENDPMYPVQPWGAESGLFCVPVYQFVITATNANDADFQALTVSAANASATS